MTSTKELAVVSAKARMLALRAVHKAQSGHPGGSLSSMDALVTLYFRIMNIRPEDPKWADRDRFVMSKGHGAPALYSVLCQRGYFSEEDAMMLRSINGHFSGHPDMNNVPGVDMSTGSLGQGISTAVGLALAAKHTGQTWRTYCVCGDGEMNEGQVWEAAMAAAKYNLDNLCVVVDSNGLQIDGKVEDVMPTYPLDGKLKAFNWNVIVCDGHDFDALTEAFNQAAAFKGKPTAIVMNTVKGKGVSFMENNAGWHGKAPNTEQLEQALAELEAQIGG